MRIGILTYHRSINYGAVMQAFSLSRRLSKIENVEVEIIDYMSARMNRYYKLFTLYRGRNGLFHIADRIEMYKAFNKSIQQLPLSPKKLVSDDVEDFSKYVKNRYDVIVVGSDAVWNYEKRGLPNPYFLIGDVTPHKLSYAASCNGINANKLSNDKLDILKKAFDKFEYLGVRDCLTEMVIEKSMCSQKRIHNCDPTFLLDFENDGLGDDFVRQLVKKLELKYNWDVNKKHIGLMLSNMNGDLAPKLVGELKKFYGDDYQIVSVYSYCKEADIPYVADLTPFEWSRIFTLFDITFSKYFHGTILSILNETPVISLSAENEMAGIPAKVEDVLTRLNLMEFYQPAKSAIDINWNDFMSTVDDLIRNPPREKMRNGIEREKKSANTFFTYVTELSRICKCD